jgi:hypothetical protein
MKCKKCGSSKLGLSQVVVVLHDIVRSTKGPTKGSVTLDEGLVEWDTARDASIRCYGCGFEFDLDPNFNVYYKMTDRKSA